MSQTRQVEPARRDAAASQRIAPELRRVLDAASIQACHAALADAAQPLCAEFGFSLLTAAEIAPAPQGPAIVWQYDGSLHKSDSHLRAWLARASCNLGRFLAFGDDAAGLVMAGALEADAPMVTLIADCTQLPLPLESAMRDLAEFSARRLYQLRRESETVRRRQRLDMDGARDAALLRASADLIWEAGSDGILHVTHIFQDRRDLARLFEGRVLGDITVGTRDLQRAAQTGQVLRSLPVTVAGAEEPLFLTACPSSGASAPFPLRGTIAAAPVQVQERLAIDTTTLETILASRHREERLRRETETMMLGLRILLGDAPFREKLEQLVKRLASAIDSDEIRLVQFRPGEAPRLVLPEKLAVKEAALAEIATLAGARPITLMPESDQDNARIRDALNMRNGDIALIALPAPAERYYLLCRARRSLNSDDHGLAERVSLLLQQAILLQADQKQILHSAKLSALGQMSTGIAHELRQPLNAISIAAQNIDLMVGLGKAGPEFLQEKTERILAQIDRACKVMDRMRRFGRKTVGDHKPASPAAIARSARSLMDPVIIASGIAVDIEIPDELEVSADELEVEQVLVNLIQNASDAMAGRPGGKIRIWSRDDPDDPGVIRLEVEDNGPGFPPEVLKHALDAFFTTKPEGKGTGLGLSIAHAILREHGGRLLVGNSEAGGGLITLVLRRPEAAFPSLASRSAMAATP
ncbi:MAG TPA: ATP-binding protein [Micropepsaceae bacterium]|jgi:signal transduction histidine kinase